MIGKKLTCLECGQSVANTHNVLSRHLRSVHSMEWADYVVKHEHGGSWPVCACGCAERLSWKKGGFGKYIRGHDARQLEPGWMSNPFTGRDEFIPTDDDVELFKHCVSVNDHVTHDHGIRIPWSDATGRMRMIVPSLKHLKHRLIMVIDSPREMEYGRRVEALKGWCDANAYMLLVMKRVGQAFDIVDGHRPKGLSVEKVKA